MITLRLYCTPGPSVNENQFQGHSNSWRPDGEDWTIPMGPSFTHVCLLKKSNMTRGSCSKPWTMKEFETPPQVIRGPILPNKITRAKSFLCFQRLVEYGAPGVLQFQVRFPIRRCSPTNELTWHPKKPDNLEIVPNTDEKHTPENTPKISIVFICITWSACFWGLDHHQNCMYPIIM